MLAFACHRAAWGQATFLGASPPEGIAKLAYVLLYDSLAELVLGALAIEHGRQVTIRRRRQLAPASSKEELAAWTGKYGESCCLNELHDDVAEDRQACGKTKIKTRHLIHIEVLLACFCIIAFKYSIQVAWLGLHWLGLHCMSS